MLAAGGLTGTWMYRKIRVLAIFDDLDTVLLMIPLQMMLVGLKWQLGLTVVPMVLLIFAAWRYLHKLSFPVTWPWVLGYGTVITLIAEIIYISSKLFDEVVPIHIEVLLPAFVLGCVMAHRVSLRDDGKKSINIIDKPSEKLVTIIVSTVFMVLVGLSMPPIIDIAGSEAEIRAAEIEVSSAYVVTAEGAELNKSAALPDNDSGLPWPAIIFHVFIVTILSNIGKLFPLFCYSKEAHWKERLALAVGMFPRGEVGAGVLIISISYGIGGTMLTVAMLSLALNLLLTGVFIIAVKKLLNKDKEYSPIPSGQINKP